MAWIKVDHDLHEKPEVAAIGAALGLDADTVVGKLLRVWRWFDKHTHDGCARVALMFVDDCARCQNFASEMEKVGWLRTTKGGVVSIPKFDRHISKSAKQRGLAAERMRNTRCARGATSGATKPQPEKRREDSNKENTKRKSRTTFARPTAEQVQAYCDERSNGISGQEFVDHYDRVGWVVGRNKTPMRDWQAAVRTWEQNRKKSAPPKPSDRVATANDLLRWNPATGVDE